MAILRVFTNPSPFVPLPFIRGEGREFSKGAKPLLIPFLNNVKGEGERLFSCHSERSEESIKEILRP